MKHKTNAQTLHVFTYGSLMYPDVFLQVTGCNPESVTAVAHHWSRYGLKNRTYPGAIPDFRKSASIAGVIWLDVTPMALAALDRFEGHEYRRVAIEVISQLGPHRAQIYEWLMPDELDGAWDPIEFERSHRQNFAQIHAPR
jgi:gamma-glutamylcyclotransferase (GGCT)/AIG2-like uncharacterized protein YtfP